MSTKGRGGFSIIEVVIVLVVIVVLIALIIPAISMSRGAMRQLLCSANLKKLHVSSQLYAMEHDEMLPLNYVMDANGIVRNWEQLLDEYIDVKGRGVAPVASQKKLDLNLPSLFCPLSQDEARMQNKLGYAMNSFDGSKSWQAYSGSVIRQRELYLKMHPEMEYSKAYGWYRTPLRLADLTDPAKTYQFVDSDERDLKSKDHRSATGRHRHGEAGNWDGTLNVQFFDGHVALYEKRGLKWEQPISRYWLPYEGY
ncbi:hypothetical protein JD969_05205 [Planctomycetota bacterium]|nr:hypothetical protein JD969_05205 [Planctomycetota bacterium]